MTIYTKKGDKGKTGLFSDRFGTKKVSKDSTRIRAIGAVDELNSYLGVVRSLSKDKNVNGKLKEIQKDLLTTGSILGGSNLRFYKTKTKKFEKEIDEIEKNLPPLKNFVLPGGSKIASKLHFARTLARRVEREVVALSEIEFVKPEILVYLNRLSDYLFMLARNENYKVKVEEEKWIKAR